MEVKTIRQQVCTTCRFLDDLHSRVIEAQNSGHSESTTNLVHHITQAEEFHTDKSQDEESYTDKSQDEESYTDKSQAEESHTDKSQARVLCSCATFHGGGASHLINSDLNLFYDRKDYKHIVLSQSLTGINK